MLWMSTVTSGVVNMKDVAHTYIPESSHITGFNTILRNDPDLLSLSAFPVTCALPSNDLSTSSASPICFVGAADTISLLEETSEYCFLISFIFKNVHALEYVSLGKQVIVMISSPSLYLIFNFVPSTGSKPKHVTSKIQCQLLKIYLFL